MNSNNMTALEKHIFSLQQKVEQLNNEVLTLIALASPEKHETHRTAVFKASSQLTDNTSALTKKSQVGINRYRQLRASE
ncbi:hypothetical protein [Spirosoma flavum]|uniref:Uncharacterized protein n=1 Tax=Spirosoma flavum TaxID=2048557 RepID=A0ABW6AQC0_9BACT